MIPSAWLFDTWRNQTLPLQSEPTLRLMTAVADSPDHNRSPETANQSTEPHRPHQLDDHGSSTLSTRMIPILTTTATQTLADGIHQPMAVTWFTRTSHHNTRLPLQDLLSKMNSRIL
jgi:hypothetical protein